MNLSRDIAGKVAKLWLVSSLANKQANNVEILRHIKSLISVSMLD